jgi:hypothetical protein
MQSATQTAATSKKTLWAGRSLSLLPILFLLFDAVFKLLRPTPTPVTSEMSVYVCSFLCAVSERTGHNAENHSISLVRQ